MITSKNIIFRLIVIVSSIYLSLSGWGINTSFAGQIKDPQTGNIIHNITSTKNDLALKDFKLDTKISLHNLIACSMVKLKQAKVNYVCLSNLNLPKFINDSLYINTIQHKNTALILYSGDNIHTLRSTWISLQLTRKSFKYVLSNVQKTIGKENLSYPIKTSNFTIQDKYSTTYLWRTKNTKQKESQELELNEISNPYKRIPNYKSSLLTLKYSSTKNPFLQLLVERLKFNIQRGYIPYEIESLK